MLTVGDEIAIKRNGEFKKVTVNGIESFRKTLDHAQAGENVGVLLRDVTKDDIARGDVLVGSYEDFSWKP
jgi:elongation factor Tu